jgi:hypothetical protein
MLLLDLLDDVIVIVVLLLLGVVSKPSLSNSKAWLLDDEIGVFLLLLDDSCGDVAIDEVITAYCWRILPLLDELPIYFGLKRSTDLFFITNRLGIIRSRSRLLLLLWVLAPRFSRSELSSITSLDFIYKLILHSVSWLIGSRARDLCIIVYQ